MLSIQHKLFGRKIFDRRIYLFILSIVLLFAFDAVAVYHSWYWTYLWLDIPVHAFAGFLLAWTFYYIACINPTTARVFRIRHQAEELFGVMVFWVVMIAIAWEALELYFGRTSISPNYAIDLFADIAITSLGAYIAYLCARPVWVRK